MFTYNDVKDICSYNQITGVITWKNRTGRKSYLNGKEVGHITSNGYRRVAISKKMIYVHRLAWLLKTKSLPIDSIDHINHNTLDNRWLNLRDATLAENQQNRTINKNNKSGFNGVHWRSRSLNWEVSLTVNGEYKYIGVFESLDEAIDARNKANSMHNFHINHGGL